MCNFQEEIDVKKAILAIAVSVALAGGIHAGNDHDNDHDSDHFEFQRGTLVLSRSVYEGTPSLLVPGVTVLPPGCVAGKVNVPLIAGFRKSFRGGPAERSKPDPKQWRVTAPKAGTSGALVVDFPTPMNYPLLQRMLQAKEIGALARPDDIRFSDMLPKTRSGKIMRRLLRELATSGEVKGDTTTLEDFSVISKLKEQDEV